MSKQNIFYAQSGGPTAVINNSACGVIETALQNQDKIGRVYAGKNGIIGALNEELIDTFLEPRDNISALRHQPGSAFGSCRYKLKNIEEDDSEYRRLIEVFKAHNIGYFFYNGGGDSQDTAYKISQLSQKMSHPLKVIGIPKTIDNDLAYTDNCPGYGSVAKYIATSILEASYDVAGMAASSTKVFIMEVMGRHAGWIAAAGGMAQQRDGDAPQIILFPEVRFNQAKFLDKVNRTIQGHGFCSVIVSEGVKNSQGNFLSDSGEMDAFGHHQLGGVAPLITDIINKNLKLKCHWAVSDYLQRSARHIASKTDSEQAYALGKSAVEFALAEKKDIMMTIERINDTPYQWKIGCAPLNKVANFEKKMPIDFINDEGFGITKKCRDYIAPLIHGEDFPPFINGIPDYRKLENKLVEKKLVEASTES